MLEVKKEALRWSKCQNLGPREQLELGIRYFDVRVAGLPGNDQTFVTHGFFGEEITELLDEVNDFLILHPKEVVLIDLHHFHNVSSTAHSRLLDFLEHTFGEKLTPRNSSFGTLKSLWDHGRQVVLIYQSELGAEKNYVWDSNSIEQPFPNTDNVSVLSTFLEDTYGRRSLDKLHITQGILTPTQATILANFGEGIEGALAPLANHAVTEWLTEKEAGIDGVNVVLVDYAEIGSVVSVVLGLNTSP